MSKIASRAPISHLAYFGQFGKILLGLVNSDTAMLCREVSQNCSYLSDQVCWQHFHDQYWALKRRVKFRLYHAGMGKKQTLEQ